MRNAPLNQPYARHWPVYRKKYCLILENIWFYCVGREGVTKEDPTPYSNHEQNYLQWNTQYVPDNNIWSKRVFHHPVFKSTPCWSKIKQAWKVLKSLTFNVYANYISYSNHQLKRTQVTTSLNKYSEKRTALSKINVISDGRASNLWRSLRALKNILGYLPGESSGRCVVSSQVCEFSFLSPFQKILWKKLP